MRQKRINQISTRLTDAELAILERLAGKKGMLPATILRVALLDYAQRNGETISRKDAS
jgi:hypothetical protein